MECPKCKTGELVLYKETAKAQFFKITKENRVYKHPFSTDEFDTEIDYLECNNMECNQYFDYELDDKGRIEKDLLRYR